MTHFYVTADYSAFPDFTCKVVFWPLLSPADQKTLGTGQAPTQEFTGVATVAMIKNGLLTRPNGDAVKLVADVGLGLQNPLQYQVQYQEGRMNGREYRLQDQVFTAPTSTTPVALQVQLSAPQGGYVKPGGGIPAGDLASSVQDKLALAATALQPNQAIDGGTP